MKVAVVRLAFDQLHLALGKLVQAEVGEQLGALPPDSWLA
jgi:hypothetical protein